MSKLQSVTDAAWLDARNDHPAYAHLEQAFRDKVKHILAKTTGADTRVKTVQRLHAPDLLLVLAVLDGVPPATVLLEKRLREQLTATLRKLFRFEVDDLVQATIVHAFQPRVLSKYKASGPVAAWACIAGIRRGISHQRKIRRRAQPWTDSVERFLQNGIQRADPLLARWAFASKLAEAMSLAIPQLSPEDRRLLRWRGQGNTIRSIATTRHQPVARTGRNVIRAQNALRKHLAREFCRLTGTPPAEFSEIMRERPSAFHLSVARMLNEHTSTSESQQSEG